MMDLKPLDLSEIATVEELQRRREDISNKYDGFMDALKKRRSHLQQALKFGYWQKDAAELKKLLEDHLALARAEHVGQTAAGFAALGDLETDNKANKAGLDRLIESGKGMIEEDHFAKSEIQRTIDDLLDLMARLEQALVEKRKKLELQQRIDEFRSQLRNMSVWIAEKLPAAESDNFGSTLEEVVALQASLVRLDNEVNASESSLTELHEESKELELEAEFQEIRGEWNTLREKLSERREKLLKSLAKHKFLEECEHLTKFIVIRRDQVDSVEISTSITECEQFLRNNDRASQEVKANQIRIDALQSQLESINSDECKESFDAVEEKWQDLLESLERQDKILRKELRNLKFEDQAQSYSKWATETIESVKSVNHPKDENELDSILEVFESQKEDAESRRAQYEFLIAEAAEIGDESKEQELKELNAELVDVIAEKKELYSDARDYFKFTNDGEGELVWINKAEEQWQTLSAQKLDSIAEAEKALAEQKILTSELDAREPRVKQLLALKIKFEEEKADNLKDQAQLTTKLEDLATIQAQQQEKIEQALKLHQFNADADELDEFIDQKYATLAECNAADLQDLPAKEQKLTAVRNDIAANQQRLKDLQTDSEELPAYAQVDSKLEEVVEHWDKLQAEVNRLHVVQQEAEQAAAFKRSCDEIESWIDNNEPKIMSTETGKDIESTKELLDTQKALADDFASQDDKIKSLEAQAQELKDKDNFKAEELEQLIEKTRTRYDELAPHVAKGDERLKKALQDFELLRNINEQRDIAAEQQTLLGSDFKPKDIISAEAALSKTRNLKSDVASADQKIEELSAEAEKSENDDIKSEAEKLKAERESLKNAIDAKDEELNNALQAFTYLSDAAEADDWIKEKMLAAQADQIGADEDEADAMLKKHTTLCDDIQAFEKKIGALKEAKDACPVQQIDLEPDRQEMKVIKAYKAQIPRELTVEEGDIVKILSNPGGEWVKVSKGSSSGYIPSECLVYIDEDGKSKEFIDLTKQQEDLEASFQKLNEKADERKDALEKQNKKFELDREAEDLRLWIAEQEQALKQAQEDGEDPEALRQKFEQFQKNQKQAEKALNGLKDKAETIGIKESPSLDAMDEKWKDLEALADDTESQIGGANRLKQFLGEAGQIAAWIQRKNVPSEVPDTLARTNAMIRRHDALEADMNAIQDRVDLLTDQVPKLTEELPESRDEIERTMDSIKIEWEGLKSKQSAHRDALTERQKFLDFMSKAKAHENWLGNMSNQLEKLKISDDLAIIEAQIMQHSEHKKIIGEKSEDCEKIIILGGEVTDSKEKVEEKSNELREKTKELDDLWEKVQRALEEAAKLARFQRDCQRFENWMEIRENALSSDDEDQNVEILAKKTDDFHRGIKQQEAKINNIIENCDKLTEEGHSQAEKIQSDKDKLLDRWEGLKAKLTERHKEIAEVETLQEFWKNADEFSEWLDEKIIIAEQPINDTNLNEGLQKHNAFKTEIEANMDRLQSILTTGEAIAEKNKEQAEIIEKRSDELKEKSEKLHKLSDDKSKAYDEAVKIRQFIAACNALEFWIVETKTRLETAEAKDLSSALKNIKKISQIQADIANKRETRDSLLDEYEKLESNEKATATKNKLIEDFDSVQLQVEAKRAELDNALKLFRFITDADEEVDWCKEKLVVVEHEAPSSDLTQSRATSLKHKHLEYEYETRSAKIDKILATGDELGDDAAEKAQELKEAQRTLAEALKAKGNELDDVLKDLLFHSNVNEEISWANDKARMLSTIDPESQNLEGVRNQLGKVQNLKIDVEAHEANAKKLKDEKENDPHLEKLTIAFLELETTYTATLKKLQDREAFLAFTRKCQYCSDWISDRQRRLAAENINATDMSLLNALLIKQDNLEDSLKSFESEGINATGVLFVKLEESNHPDLEQAELKWEELKLDWDELKRLTKNRRDTLEQQKSKLRGFDELCIEFAKRAGAFNSWFENVEENLTDPITSGSVQEVEKRFMDHDKDVREVKGEEASLVKLRLLDEKIRTEAKIEDNPYTWYQMGELESIWDMTGTRLTERMKDLEDEKARQVRFDEMRKQFADFANKFAEFINSIRNKLHSNAHETLEEQLHNVIDQENAIRAGKRDLDLIEKLNATMEQELIFDNEYTKHSALGLSQSWDGVIQMCQRMQRSLKQQIEARSKTGISEERIQEWRECFEHFDVDNTGLLDFIGMKSLFRSLGIDLALKDGDQESDDFLEILAQMNLSCESAVSKDEFISYMITRETTQVRGKDDIFVAFKAIADPEKPYITEKELRSNLTSEQAEYCLRIMPVYKGADAPMNENTLDYHKFVNEYFK